MSVSIISCPKCNTMLLDDADQCPNCQHILDREKPVETESVESRSDAAATGEEFPCPSCGEMVRRGLVRCWNCSTFMQDEIEKSYHGMQESPSPVTYSRLPDNETMKDNPTQPSEESAEGSFSENWLDEELFNLPDIEDDELLLAPLIDLEPEPAEDDFETAPGFEPRVDESVVAAPPAEPETTASPEISAAPEISATEPASTASTNDEASSSGDTGSASWITGDPMTSKDPAASSGEDSTASPESGSSAAVSGPTEDIPSQASDSSGEMSHSEATAGDVLLRTALDQEVQATQRRKKSRRKAAPGRVLVYCPHGHRVDVSERHRGRTGRCPKCKSLFFVPAEEWIPPTTDAGDGDTPAGDTAKIGIVGDISTEGTGPELQWMEDVHLHKVDPSKLKLKAGSLAGEFHPIDLGFADEKIVLVELATAKPGLFGGKNKKKDLPEDTRETVRAELEQNTPLKELSAAWSDIIDAESVDSIVIVQPAEDDYASMFAGIPVFGEKRIAVRIPKPKDEKELRFLSFGLNTFRKFSQYLTEVYQVSLSAENFDIPMTDSFVEKTCHYSEQTLLVLQNVEFYQADPNFDVKLIGRECQACGLALSEDSRKKEKIGGSSGRGIAKAKCPQCSQRFGTLSLFTIDGAEESILNANDDSDAATGDGADAGSSADAEGSTNTESAT